VIAGNLARGERVVDDPEYIGEPLPGLPPVLAEPVVLDRDGAAADPELEAAIRELIERAVSRFS